MSPICPRRRILHNDPLFRSLHKLDPFHPCLIKLASKPMFALRFDQKVRVQRMSAGRILMAAIGLMAGADLCLAGYSVDSHVESAGGTNFYSWVVYNEDQSWGLDGFAVEVPVQTHVLARTVPPPHSNP